MDKGMNEKERHYILATSSIGEERNRVLKHGETFLVTNRQGDIRPLGFESHGLFHQETRFLSRLTMRLNGMNPLLLSSAVREDNDLLSVDMTNPDFEMKDGTLVRNGTIYINRSIFLWEGSYYEHVRVSNYGMEPAAFSLSFHFESDYADIFEVRGARRRVRGEMLPSGVEDSSVILGYRGLDGVTRKTRVEISPQPATLNSDAFAFFLNLGSHREEDLFLTVSCELEQVPNPGKKFEAALREVLHACQMRHEDECLVETSNEQFNEWLGRSMSDLCMLLTDTPHGLYPYAGIPWFSTVFGRDGIITALQTLWIFPDIARGVLSYLAAEQATLQFTEQEADPGKILHELRNGEMAALKEVPFGRYYGTADATPLFVVLAGYYYERVGDAEFIRRLWPNIERALDWIDNYGDLDRDGFIEYARQTADGLINQGWKDSANSVFHADGSAVLPPIALCEVQGYVYEAKVKAGHMAIGLGEKQRGEQLLKEAEALREKFLKTFWSKELGTYVLALDGNKQPCMVKSSNAGHCLFSGIASKEHARSLVESFMAEGFFSGWGIRTIASSEARYNPMSYHNGSVWPHDNAMVAYGMARYGFKDAAAKVLSGLFDASIFLDLSRLPELFCGFPRSPGEGPVLYPVACDPQAWAAGSVFMLLKACLGLSIQAKQKKVYFNRPVLPAFIEEMTIRNLKMGPARLDIALTRLEEDVSVNLLHRKGHVDLVINK